MAGKTVNIYRIGYLVERKLALRLWRLGFAVIRAPASGRARKLFYPDLVAMKDGKILVIEVKALKKPHEVKIDKERYTKLLLYAMRAGGKAYLVVYVKSLSKWSTIPLEDLKRTSSGDYVATVDMLKAYPDIESVVSQL